MEGETVRTRLERLVIAHSRLTLTSVADDDILNFELGYDSHALLNLLLSIEDEFGFEVPPETVPELVQAPFSTLIDLVQKGAPAARGRGVGA